MCDKANDQVLRKWAIEEGDAHSPIITNAWREIFLYRAGLKDQMWTDYKGFLNLRGNAINYLVAIKNFKKENQWWHK